MTKVTFPVVDFYKTNGGDHSFATTGPSLTRQEFAEECDINTLMSRYEGHVSGGPNMLPPMPDAQPGHFVDWTTQPQTLMEYMDLMQTAEQAFMSLPAVVRKEFSNDPIEFANFAADPQNQPQMATWGLAKAPEPPKVEVPAVSPSPSEPPQAAPTHVST